MTTLLDLLADHATAWTLPGSDPQLARRARRLVRDALALMPPELVDDALVVASELVTNAARHTRSRCGEVGLALDVTPDAVTVAVLDQGADGVPVIAPSGRITSGRGLSLCAALGHLDWTPVDAGGCLVSVALDVAEVPA